ncbi:hypothetical protein BH11ACT4_BH11ACT4_23620 [soil metagenome]
MSYLGHALSTVALRLWHLSSPRSWHQLPRPDGRATVHAPGINADRILLVGSGGTVGYGVLSHDLGVAGHLARRVSELTGRGTDVDVITEPELGPVGVHAVIAGTRLARYDLVMLTIGGLEALQLVPRRKWRRQLSALFDSIIAAGPASLSIVMIGVAVMPTLVRMPARAQPIVERAGNRMNEESLALAAARDQVSFVPFSPRGGDFADIAGSELYSEWAAMVAPAIAQVLDTHAAHAAEPVDEQARLRAVRQLLAADNGRDERIDRMVGSARDLFGATGAALTLIDSDEQWTQSSVGMSPETVPRSEAFCATTIAGPGVFVVEDAAADDRFTAWSTKARPVRFYAGYPLETPDGHRVGALCIVDSTPRSFSESDASLLRELALTVQGLLWEKLQLRTVAGRGWQGRGAPTTV